MNHAPMKAHSGYVPAFLGFLKQRSLRIPCCGQCGQVLSFAERLCSCHPRAAVEWRPASGRASLHSFTVYRIGYASHLLPPYCVVVVELEEGPRLVSTLSGAGQHAPRIGSALKAAFEAEGRLVFLVVEEGDKHHG